MKALVYHGPGSKSWEDVPKPEIGTDTDAIVRVDAVTICGTDLHISRAMYPSVTTGRILGHEAVGTVEEVGAGVKQVNRRRPRAGLLHLRVRRMPLLPRRPLRTVPGRRRLDPRPPDRRDAGRVRARPVRRHLDLPAPDGVSDEALLMLADILPTGYEVRRAERSCPARRRRRRGRRRPDRPLGDHRRAPSTARRTSSPSTSPTAAWTPRSSSAPTWSSTTAGEDPASSQSRRSRTALGADVAIEAVGVPATFELAGGLVRPGGRVANIGVHGEPATLHLEDLWSRDVTITTGLVDTFSTPTSLPCSKATRSTPAAS